MKRSTKRTVGWGTGVAIGVVFLILTFVLVVALSSGPIDAAPEGGIEMVEHQAEE